MPDNVPEWIGGFENAGVTSENKEAFQNYAKNYQTEGDAIVAGYNHKKLVGAPYKLPESMDKLPDDKTRGELRGSALKLLGMEPAANVEALADLNLKAGMAEGIEPDVDLANMFKTVAVEKKWSKSVTQDIIELHNTVQAQARAAAAEKTLKDAETAAQECDAKLVAHPDFGSEEELLRQTELFKRAMENNVGLTPEEVTELGEGLALSTITTNPVLQRVMLKQFVPLAEEGDTPPGGGGGGGGATEQTPYQWKKARWESDPSMWGKEDAKWEDQSPEFKKIAGYKKKE